MQRPRSRLPRGSPRPSFDWVTRSSNFRSRRRPRASRPSTSASSSRRRSLTTLDYGFANTAATRSAITYLDGDAGILRYRGYPIEELAERSTFLETAYLLIYGELPTAAQLATGRRLSSATPCSTRSSGASSTAFRWTPIRWPSWPRRSPPSRRSTRTPRTRPTPTTSRSARSGSSRRCRRSPRTPTRSRSANRSSTRTTASTSRRTSCG